MARMSKTAGAPGKAKVSFKAPAKKKKTGAPTEAIPTPRLKTRYEQEILPILRGSENRSPLAVPRITKVVLSMGIGDAHENAKKFEALLDDLEAVSGQRPAVTRARVSVANFKLREGMPVGLMVTLRRGRMWEFLDRLISVVIPRMRDFRGLSPKGFDRRGNYNFGMPDQLMFPEVNTDRVDFMHGMNITICTTAQTDEEARELLRLVGMPFRDLEVEIIGKEKR